MKRLLLDSLRLYRFQTVLVVSLVLVQALANLYLPDLNAQIINNGVARGDTAYITRTGGFMLLVSLVVAVCSIAAVYFGSRIAMRVGRDIRSRLFRKVESFAQAEVNRFGTPSLINRNTNDVQQVQMLVAIGLNMMIMAPLMGVGGIIMALRQDVPLSALLAVIIPLMLVVISILVTRAIPLFRSMQVKLDRINQVMRETLAGIRVIRAFVRTRYEEERFQDANLDLLDIGLRVTRLFALMMPTLFLILNMSTVAIMYFGAHRIAGGDMPIGNLTAFIAYVMQILISVMMATMMMAMVPRAAASADRIQEVLEVEPAIVDPPAPKLLPAWRPKAAEEMVPVGGTSGNGRRGVVEFKDVEFRYPGAENAVLRDISFRASPGTTTAIMGSTGSGKSTLINLIPRFFDVTAGAIEIDGVDIRDLAQADLWSMIGFVPQKAFLFSGTVASNLRFGDETATDVELWHALELAQARDFVMAMPEGLEASIAQGGANVSGGQRQRLAIARALVKRPLIYVLDDSFSALDFQTDARLRAALKQETKHATVFIVAQRVSTILHADQIVVLDEGTICGVGRHDELIKSCDCYREIVFSQLSEEEVA
ncbi:MAG: ABC transporter ATP-binding protein [Actinobacteria bacterium]|nr:ABC transporter ATP-binding protein [Actinomycetota bacterium]